MDTATPMNTALKRFTYLVLVLASIYHLYLVLHPFTPWSSFQIPVLDLTQVQRATHVFLIVFAGSLLMVIRPQPVESQKVGIGLWIYAALAVIPLFWEALPPEAQMFIPYSWSRRWSAAAVPRAARR